MEGSTAKSGDPGLSPVENGLSALLLTAPGTGFAIAAPAFDSTAPPEAFPCGTVAPPSAGVLVADSGPAAVAAASVPVDDVLFARGDSSGGDVCATASGKAVDGSACAGAPTPTCHLENGNNGMAAKTMPNPRNTNPHFCELVTWHPRLREEAQARNGSSKSQSQTAMNHYPPGDSLE